MKSEEMVDVTVQFLGRTGAVRQALELAGWEMTEIGEGEWSSAVWGGVSEAVKDGVTKTGDAEGRSTGDGESAGPTRKNNDKNEDEDETVQWTPPTHHFLFAKQDHWVADETRETIIKSMNGRAKILVDEGELGLVHAWCLEQSEMVAGIVSGWIEEMLFGDGEGSEVKGDVRVDEVGM